MQAILTYICVHCKRKYYERAGRGLCRPCWNKPTIRQRYAVIAPFGGKLPSDRQYDRLCTELGCGRRFEPACEEQETCWECLERELYTVVS